MADLNELFKMKVVYQIPDINGTEVKKDIVYSTANGENLCMDLYLPKNKTGEGKCPIVIFVHGEAPVHNLKDAGQYSSLGEIISCCKMAVAAFNHRTPVNGAKFSEVICDIEEAIKYLRENADTYGISRDRIALWAMSAGNPAGLYCGMHNSPEYIKCIVSYYGFTSLKDIADAFEIPSPADEFEEATQELLIEKNVGKIAPIFMARAGLDNPFLNKSIENFIIHALRNNLNIDIYNHPMGHHAFDVFDDNPRTHEIIEKTIEFLKRHLL